jgi:omega-hydroxy-beta-dihydromenaquinone-9 sulfotransferase
MNYAYLLAGITVRSFIQQLGKNKFSFSPRYLIRILFIFQSAFWSSLFAFIENRRFKKKILSSPVPDDPIFIIGHWRSGSTYLHQLMSKNSELKAPSLFEVAIPKGFLSSGAYYRPVFSAMLSEHRPMDNVKMGFDEPQEDEYAFYRLSNYSPLEYLIFPPDRSFPLSNLSSFLPEGKERKRWAEAVRFYYRKLHFKSRKRIISKNPFNSLRIPELISLFPNARFIHIYRNPLIVVPSTIHMFSIVQKQNCLNGNGTIPTVEEITRLYDRVISEIKYSFSQIPPVCYTEIKFEEFEVDPVKSLQKIYEKFNVPFGDDQQKKLYQFLSENGNYRKNTYQLTDQDRDYITENLRHHMEQDGYL